VPRLEIPGYDLALALKLERELGVSHVLAQILVRRGLGDPVAARVFLEPAGEHPPSAFAGIEQAVSVIQRHVAQGSQIAVHGDYDVDGVCATALMVRALRELGAQVEWVLPSRAEDGYGFTSDSVSRLVARGVQLVITVDCGITAVDEVAEAGQAGIDVVVTDHHRPRADGCLPDCPVVHPTVCHYPFADLCGTGVAYKLACALGAHSPREDLELVALATVADLVPLRGENRFLVRTGLRALAGTEKPGLRALLDVAGCDPSGLDAGALGFRLAPRINAAGRLARADAGVELLLCPDEARAHEIAVELDRLNGERRAIEQRITWEAQAQVAELGARSAYVLAGAGWNPGVVGIVASRIAERHHRPAIVVALPAEGPARGPGLGQGSELAQGSARSIPGFDLLGALHACAEHLERYGGHQAAAGLTIRPDAIEPFRAALEAYASSVLTSELLTPVERIDALVSGSELGLGLAEELELLEPTGIGSPRPRLLIPGARFGDCRTMGEGRHARFTVLAGGSRTPAVAFGCDGRLGVEPGEAVDAAFRLERNCWNGAVESRLLLRHAWPCAPPPIEILDPEEPYLAAAWAELERVLEEPGPVAGMVLNRTVLDRRGHSPLTALADAVAAGGPVLAVCADVPRRLEGLRTRCGGFALITYHALERDPVLAIQAEHLVALDPPAGDVHDRLLRLGTGYTHLSWGEAELRFAQQMHELEYGLRSSLIALYRALRPLRRVVGEEVERLLRGQGGTAAEGGGHGRPPRLAGRLIRVLAELELVQIEPGPPALATTEAASTTLERSPAYRAYAKRYQDGRLFLSSASLRPAG